MHTKLVQLRSSLRFKITAWYVTTLALAAFIAGGGIYWSIAQDQRNDADALLAGTMRFVIDRLTENQQLPRHSAGDLNRLALGAAELDHEGLDAGRDVLFLRLASASQDRPLFESRALRHSSFGDELGSLPHPAPGDRPTVFIGKPGQNRIRALSATLPGSDVTIQIALPWDRRDAELQETALRIAVAIAGFLILSAAGAWTAVTRSLTPVAKIASNAQAITADRMSEALLPPSADSDWEIRELVSALNSMMSRLHRSVVRQREFTADAAHELRTPLTIMRGEIEFALRKPQSVEKYTAVLRSALEEIERLSRIVESLGLIARADSDLGRLVPYRLIDLCVLCADAAAQFNLRASEKNVRLEILRVSAPVLVMGDSDALIRVFANLIQNAIAYSPAGGTVWIDAQYEDHLACVKISDNGFGIVEEDLDHIFDRFYRADKARANSGGYGLGLAIVRAIVDAHGGTVSAKSQLGLGSTFTVSLPAAPARIAAEKG